MIGINKLLLGTNQSVELATDFKLNIIKRSYLWPEMILINIQGNVSKLTCFKRTIFFRFFPSVLYCKEVFYSVELILNIKIVLSVLILCFFQQKR